MEGTCKCGSVFLALLLCYILNTVTSAPSDKPGNSSCQSTQVKSNITGQVGLAYSCTITPENTESVLRDIKADHLLSLFIGISERCLNFVFGNASFSKDLEILRISSYFPMAISAGTFSGSRHISQLTLFQKHYLTKIIVVNDSTSLDKADEPIKAPQREHALNVSTGSNRSNQSTIEDVWVSLHFETSWLAPIPDLTQLSLSNNLIHRFPDMHFCHLKKLTTLDIGNNLLDSWLGITCNISKGPCTPCLPKVIKLILRNNPITDLNINISYNLPLLRELDVSGCALASVGLDTVLSPNIKGLILVNNQISSLLLGSQGFCNSSLENLYLAINRLYMIEEGLFECTKHVTDLLLQENFLGAESLIAAGLNILTKVTRLYLSYNDITTLSAQLIGNMVNLNTFACEACGLTTIENGTFTNLKNLKWLLLGKNRLHSIDGSTFTYLSNLYHLDVSNNLLADMPDISSPIPGLRVLILDGNNISKIVPERLSGLPYQLVYLSLAFNQIKHIPANAFSSVPFLQELNLNGNKLKTLKYNKAYPQINLQTLRLSDNLLQEIPSMALDLNNLQHIDLSWNRIRSVQLGTLDTWKTIDLSHNSITKFEGLLSDLKNLLWMNLTNNNLSRFSEGDFLSYTKPRPQVLLEGNPLHCDCEMEWLLKTRFNRPYEERKQRIFHDFNPSANGFKDIMKYATRIFYAEVPDLELLECRTSGIGSKRTPFIKTYFVCPYTDECIDWGCYDECCSEDDDCPCRAFCYPDCSCYHKNNHKVDFMNCTSRNVTSLPLRRPIYAKQIYLDGNNLTQLNSEHLDFPELTELFLNKSNIVNVHGSAFKKLEKLESLHLDQNHIQQIESSAFRYISKLRELYLQDNEISSLENDSLLYLPYLRRLKLHGNNLSYLNMSMMEGLNGLTELTLSENPWLCDCDRGPVFRQWLIKHHETITDVAKIFCWNSTVHTDMLETELKGTEFRGAKTQNTHPTPINEPLIHIDFVKICSKKQTKYVKSLAEVAVLAAVFGIIGLTAIMIYKNLILIKICLYNRCGVRFRREEDDNVDRPYDIFLTYPKQDEIFVVQHFLPELEVGDMSYRVCLEGRDWPPGADKAETFLASVQQSKRTILVVSEHHFSTQWCEFTFEAGHYQVLMDKQIRLIIILMDKNLEGEMNRTMKMYLKTNAYLVVGEKWFWKKLRYYLADNPRGADEDVGREFRLMSVYDNQGR